MHMFHSYIQAYGKKIFLNKTYVVVTQKNSLNERVLLSTKNIPGMLKIMKYG